MNTVVIVDNDSKMILNYKRMLESYQGQMQCVYFRYPEEALDYVREKPPAVIICELELPVMSGKEVFDMVEMMSPTTIKIAMSQVSDVRKTLDIMNQSRIFKLIIKPFFLMEDIAEPILSGLKYHEMQMKEENIQRNAAIELEMLNKRAEELGRKLEEKKQSYNNMYNTAVGIIRGNLIQGRINFTDEERNSINRIFEGLFHQFIRYYMFEARNYMFHANYIMNLFHHPEKGCVFQIRNKLDCEVSNEIMQQMAYTIFLTGYLCAETLEKYHAAAFIEEEGAFYVVKLLFKSSAGEENHFKVKSRRVVKVMMRMVERVVSSLASKGIRGTTENPFVAKIYYKKEEGMQ